MEKKWERKMDNQMDTTALFRVSGLGIYVHLDNGHGFHWIGEYIKDDTELPKGPALFTRNGPLVALILAVALKKSEAYVWPDVLLARKTPARNTSQLHELILLTNCTGSQSL